MTISDSALSTIKKLPKLWHTSGSISAAVMSALATLPPAEYSVETGTGKSTLIFSQISQHHVVFAKDDDGSSLRRVQENSILNADRVEFVIGPAQRTLPLYRFAKPVDIAFLDGPHGYPFPELEYLHIYPHIKPGGWLILDDCHIPTVARLADFIKTDKMFRFERRAWTALFFKRTDAPAFCPTGDGWESQEYNRRHFPVLRHLSPTMWPRFLMPESVKRAIRSVFSQIK